MLNKAMLEKSRAKSRTKAAVATLAVGLVASSASFAASAPASAGGGTYHGCRSGNVCLYNGDLSESYLNYQTPGAVPDGKYFWVIVNNGNPSPGLDHVRFQYKYYGGSKWYSECLHYRPGSGYKLDLRDGAVPAQIRNMSWGGEC